MDDKTQMTKTEQEVTKTERVESGPTFSPRVDIIEKEEGMLVLADMPGVSKDRVSVVLEKGVLTIDGEVDMPREDGLSLSVCEYEVGHFHRAFEVGPGLDANGVEAGMKDGVLRLRIPKREELRPRRIEIKGE